MADKTLNQIKMEHELNKPTVCSVCNSKEIEYLGLGQYRCRECMNVMFDDYGRVRQYVEEHPGVTEIDVHLATGVSRESIRAFIKEDRFEVVNQRNRHFD